MKNNNYIKNTIDKHPIVVLMCLMMVSSVIIYFPFFAGKSAFIYADIGSDTTYVYFPFFKSLVRKITSLDFSLWTFEYGLGTNILSRQSDVMSPFTYLVFVFGMKNIKYGLLLSQVSKIFLSGILCYKYLDLFKFSNVSKIITSYVAAFNGYIMLWGQHYFMGTACVFIFLMLYTSELAIRDTSKLKWLALSSFAIMLNSFYIGYMIMMFAAGYILLRLLYKYDIKHIKEMLVKATSIIVAVFTGIAMAGVAFLPTMYYTAYNTPRLSSGQSLISRIIECLKILYPGEYYHTLASRFFSGSMRGHGEGFGGYLNYYEAPQVFFSSLIVVFIFIYFFESILSKNNSTKNKVYRLLSLFIVGVILLFPVGSYTFNGFAALTLRFTFVLMPIFAVWFADGIDRIYKKQLRFPIVEMLVAVILGILSARFGVSRFVEDVDSFHMFKLAVAAMLGFLILCVIYVVIKSHRLKLIFAVLLYLICSASVIKEGYITTNRDKVRSSESDQVKYLRGNRATSDALEYIESIDDTFYRTEKTYLLESWYNDSMLNGYNGISYYNSVISTNQIEIYDKLWPQLFTLRATHGTGYATFTADYGNNELATVFGIKYVLSENEMSIDGYELLDNVSGIYIYKNVNTDSIARFYSSVINYDTYSQDEENQYDLREYMILEGCSETKKGNNDGYVTVKKPSNSGNIKVEAECNEDGYVYVAIPCDEGWTAYVDGEKTDIQKADIGFSAVRVETGKHEIVFKYRTPKLMVSAIISIAGLVLFVVLTVYLKKSKKKFGDIQ